MTTDFSGAQLFNLEILCENKESIFLSTDYQKAKLNETISFEEDF